MQKKNIDWANLVTSRLILDLKHDGKTVNGMKESLPTIPILNCPKLPVFFTMHSAVSKA